MESLLPQTSKAFPFVILYVEKNTGLFETAVWSGNAISCLDPVFLRRII